MVHYRNVLAIDTAFSSALKVSGMLVERRDVAPLWPEVQQRVVQEGEAIGVARGQDDRVQRL